MQSLWFAHCQYRSWRNTDSTFTHGSRLFESNFKRHYGRSIKVRDKVIVFLRSSWLVFASWTFRYDSISIRRLEPFLLIQSKISKCEYSHPDEFKVRKRPSNVNRRRLTICYQHDIDSLFTKVRSVTTVQQQNDIDQLYQSVIASTKLEVDRAHPNLMDSSTLDPNYQRSVRTALFRPTLDGFIFTDANAVISQLDEQLRKLRVLKWTLAWGIRLL